MKERKNYPDYPANGEREVEAEGSWARERGGGEQVWRRLGVGFALGETRQGRAGTG